MKRLFVIFSVLVIASLLLTACGGGGGGSSGWKLCVTWQMPAA